MDDIRSGAPDALAPPVPAPPAPDLRATDLRLSSLSRRGVAIIIDAVVFLLAVVMPISSTHGSLPGPGSAGFTINEHSYFLRGVPLWVAIAAWLAYMILCEATVGASLGKAVMGIRVRKVAGPGCGIGAATIRNLVRFIDFLPFFYVIGAIVAWRSSKDQRIGDHLAGTVVIRKAAATALVPPPPIILGGPGALHPPLAPRRPLRKAGLVIGLLLLASAVTAYTAMGRTPPGLYRLHGITFDYPTTWRGLQGDATYEAGATPLFKDGVGIDQADRVMLRAYPLRIQVDDANLPEVQAQVAQLVPGLVQGVNGSIDSGLQTAHVAGLPALTLALRYPSPAGEAIEHETFVFSGSTEYLISCAWTDAHAQEMQAGCDQVLNTVRIG